MFALTLVSCGDASEVASTAAPTTTRQPDTVAATTTSCLHTVQVERGANPEVATLDDIGHLGAAVLVVQVAPGESRTIVDEDPAPVIAGQPLGLPSNSPYVLTRYEVTATQVVVWPDSAPPPTIGDPLVLDVEGGTFGCFVLEAPNALTLEPATTYLVAAGVRDASQLRLWNDNFAVKIEGGVIGRPADGVPLPAALAALVGQPVSALPPASVIHSILEP